MENRAAGASPEVIHRGARLVVSGGGVGKEIRSVELRTVPKLVQAFVKPIRARLSDIVDLSSAVSALVDGLGEGIDRYLRD